MNSQYSLCIICGSITVFCIYLPNNLIDEKNPKLKEIYQQKFEEYIQRAQYIKKQVLQPENVSQGGGSAAAQKPKYEFYSEIKDFNRKMLLIEIKGATVAELVEIKTQKKKRNFKMHSVQL